MDLLHWLQCHSAANFPERFPNILVPRLRGGAHEQVLVRRLSILPSLQFKMQRLHLARRKRLDPFYSGSKRFRFERLFRLQFKMLHRFHRHGEFTRVQFRITQPRFRETGVIGEEFLLQNFCGQLRLGFHRKEKDVSKKIRLIGLEHTGSK